MKKFVIPANKPVFVLDLRDELSAALGRPVSVDVEPAANGKTGQVIILDPVGGQILDLDEKVVSSVIKSHVVRKLPNRDDTIAAAEAKANEGDVSGALADVLNLLKSEASS